ncbi:diguanylate cyclase [Candidatus Poribacteria bacterium]|nr:diguanylate cyclase [Candidatus Poribacteria bacterium]
MKKILFVEDSEYFASIVMDKFKSELDYELVWKKNLSETVELLKNYTNYNFFASILDFKLPDAPNGEIIDAVVSKGIPAIIFTGYVDKEVRDTVWSKFVVDYILKEDYQSMDYILSLLKHLDRNPEHKIIVVDNSLSFRKIITDLLKVHRYNVIATNDGNEALKLIEENPDTKIIITEYKIAGLDGLALTHRIREKYIKDSLAIIGISDENKQLIAPRFLKYGANDFISKKTFITEEFYRRITQNIENLEHINTIKETSIKDYLTGLFNRRYFFEFGQKLIANVARGNISMVCAMLDIDNFKKVNDTFGHKAGDVVLQKISSLLKERMRTSDIVARIGGEEFGVIAVNMKKEYIKKVFEDICKKIEKTAIEIGVGTTVKITLSIGVCTKAMGNIDEYIIEADKFLMQAKSNGRNRVEMDE